MIYIIWLLSIVITFKAGYSFRTLINKIIDRIRELDVKQKIHKSPEVEEPPSNLIDLTDPIAEAKYEQEKLMRELNEIK